MFTPLVIAVALGYLLALPILLRLVGVAHTKLVVERAAQGPRSRQVKATVPAKIWPKMRQRLGFTMKDKRVFTLKGDPKESGLSNAQVLWLIYGAGLAMSLWGAHSGSWKWVLFGYLTFFVFITFGILRADPVIKKREKVYTKLFEVARSSLGQSAEYAQNPQAVVTVQEWREVVKPTKVVFQVPTSFSADSQESFLRLFNQNFGHDTTWVAHVDPDNKVFGWDYDNNIVTLIETPPLPMKAAWSEHYVLDPSVAWSFFPLGLGVENGIELTNPATGEVENVLGFDVAGEQLGLSNKLGTYCSPSIVTAPMALVAGATGGGKALSVDTPVRVYGRVTPPPSE